MSKKPPAHFKRRHQDRQPRNDVPPEHQLGDAPIEPAYFEKMNAIAITLDEFLNGEDKGAARRVGFVMMVFEYGNTDGRCNYISNGADRADIVALMKEMIARFEGQPEMEGKA
jgi:hypothetical protein